MRWILLFALSLCTACSDASTRAGTKGTTISFVDSIHIRRSRALEHRPDTMGARVDLTRIAGSPTAPVWMVIVSDFQCDSCRAFAVNVLPLIRKEYVDAGRVRIAFVNDPQEIHFNARFAANAALCAGGSGRFWEMHDSLFASQQRWARLTDPQPFFDSLAISAGADSASQHRCIERHSLLNLLTGDLERSQKSQVTSVPTVFAGDRRLTGAQLQLSTVRRVLDEVLATRK